jgi:hypothetical protein
MEKPVEENSRRKLPLWGAVLAGITIGLLATLGVRAATYTPDVTHYHANFALFIDGQRDKFDNFTFYEEVQSCSSSDTNNPRHRVHMHNKESDTVHVHADGVTWGHFFANLGYGLSDSAVETDAGVFVDGLGGRKLTFMLNGEEADSVANRIIGREDVLLVTYGDPSDAQDQYDQIRKNAGEHNHKPDPASCSGSQDVTFKDRIKHAVDFTGGSGAHTH